MNRFGKSDTDRLVAGLAADYGNDLIRFIAKRLGSAADARDLAHEAYIRLLRVQRRDLIRNPRAYLYRIAANILYEFELKKKADAVALTQWSQYHTADTEPGLTEHNVEALLLRKRIEAVLSQLSPKCRACLILCRRDGMTYEEIAARIGISPSMVKKYLALGLRHCREHLTELR